MDIKLTKALSMIKKAEGVRSAKVVGSYITKPQVANDIDILVEADSDSLNVGELLDICENNGYECYVVPASIYTKLPPTRDLNNKPIHIIVY